MNHSQKNMERMVALAMIAYAIGLLIGEGLRDHLYGEALNQSASSYASRSAQLPVMNQGKKWKLYSGLFILLKQKIRLPAEVIRRIVANVLEAFIRRVQHPVRTFV